MENKAPTRFAIFILDHVPAPLYCNIGMQYGTIKFSIPSAGTVCYHILVPIHKQKHFRKTLLQL